MKYEAAQTETHILSKEKKKLCVMQMWKWSHKVQLQINKTVLRYRSEKETVHWSVSLWSDESENSPGAEETVFWVMESVMMKMMMMMFRSSSAGVSVMLCVLENMLKHFWHQNETLPARLDHERLEITNIYSTYQIACSTYTLFEFIDSLFLINNTCQLNNHTSV